MSTPNHLTPQPAEVASSPLRGRASQSSQAARLATEGREAFGGMGEAMSTKRIQRAAGRFYQELTSDFPRERSQWDGPQKAIYTLIESAFILYQESWGRRWNIAEWQWPFDALADYKNGERQVATFEAGSQPWTVLFREAVRLAAQEPAR